MASATDHRCPPVSSSAGPVELSRGPGRARLAAAGAELAAATAALAEAQQRASRLAAAVAGAAQFEAELAALRASGAARLGAWLAASGDQPRPEPDAAITDAECRLPRLSEDAAAARAALPAAEQQFRHCAETVRALQRQRDEAICAAAVEAARAYAERYRAALTAALEQEARLRGLREELVLWGNRADAAVGALSAAAEIGELVNATRRAAAVDRNPQAGRNLLAALAADPDAIL